MTPTKDPKVQKPKVKKPFFVFYLKIPKALRMFLLKVTALFLIGFFGTGLWLGMTQDDPGKAGYRGDYGRQKVVGVLETQPYPLLRVTKGSKRIKVGHTLMLTGTGKDGVTDRATSLNGQLVQVEGIVVKRGDLEMLQIRGGKRGLSPVIEGEDIATPVQSEAIQLGKWKIAGEICDGKCLAGAMNPGRGIAHKACANLCLLGDIPPVFVSYQKVEGSNYFLMANDKGGPLGKESYDYIGQLVEIEGSLERRGDLIIIKTEKIENLK